MVIYELSELKALPRDICAWRMNIILLLKYKFSHNSSKASKSSPECSSQKKNVMLDPINSKMLFNRTSSR